MPPIKKSADNGEAQLDGAYQILLGSCRAKEKELGNLYTQICKKSCKVGSTHYGIGNGGNEGVLQPHYKEQQTGNDVGLGKDELVVEYANNKENAGLGEYRNNKDILAGELVGNLNDEIGKEGAEKERKNIQKIKKSLP